MDNAILALRIKGVVCEVCGITPDDMERRCRRRAVADARKMLAFLLYDGGVCRSVAEVAAAVGLCRNSGYKTIYSFVDLVKYDPVFRSKFRRACRVLSLTKYDAADSI